MAVIYGVILTGIFVLIYNLVAKFAGGIKISLQQENPTVEAAPRMPGSAETPPPYAYE